MDVIPPTERQRNIELQVIASYDRDIKMANKRSAKSSRNYKRKTVDKPKPDGRLIRSLMNQAKMKPKDLWSKANITSDQLQKTFRGVGTDFDKIESLAEVLKVEVKYLIKENK